MNRKNLFNILGFLITGLLIILAVYKIDWAETLDAFQEANYSLVLAAATSMVTAYVLRAVRWKSILAPRGAFPFSHLFPILVIGFAANNVLPGRAGEFARAYLLGQKEGISKSLSFATVVLERVFDGLTIILVLALVALFRPLPLWGRQVAYASTAFFVSALLFLTLLLFRKEKALSLARVVLRLLPGELKEGRGQAGGWKARFLGMLASFADGLDALRSTRDLAAVVLYSLAVWLCEAITFYLVMRSFPLPLQGIQEVWGALFLLSIVNLGIMIPAAPGGVGPYQAAAILALGAFGVDKELALSVSLVSHSLQYIIITGLGFFFLWREGLSLSRIVRTEESLTDSIPGG